MKENTMQVQDIMTPTPVTVTPGMSVSEAWHLMQQRHIHHLPVLEDGHLVGLLTDRDIRTVLPSPATGLAARELTNLLRKLTVGNVLTQPLLCVSPEQTITAAATLLLRQHYSAILVVEQQQVVGIVTHTDMLRALLRSTLAIGDGQEPHGGWWE
jgi:acetoin utilization protein AcuB